MKKSKWGILLVLLFPVLFLHAQTANINQPDTANKKGTIAVAANTRYNKAGGIKKMFLGNHYRKEWAQPVEVKIINLDSAGGGLTPIREGGGHQTKSLRLRGKDGKEYVLRSVNKDPTKALPPDFAGTFAADIVQDQISSSNPYAPLVVAELAKAAGIYHITPEIVYVPESPRLDTFSKNFANTLCIFEVRPSGSQKNNPEFDYADDIDNSERMLRRVATDQQSRVDELAFLKARLFDTWIGDWDRHEDQWVWAAFKTNDKTIYKPIPRDRDQAFARLDGIIPKAASRRWAVRSTKNFFDPLHDVAGLNLAGVYLDRAFTTSLTLQDWKDVAAELQKNLTDEKIEAAFNTLPESIFNISGPKTIKTLKSRRASLIDYATKYYKVLSKQVDVMGTQRREDFQITRLGDSTKIVVLAKNEKGEENLLFYRIFHKHETKELRLYGLGGNDVFTVSGSETNGIRIRIIGGGGRDIYTESRETTTKAIRLYDDKSDFDQRSEGFKRISNYDTSSVEYKWRKFKYDWYAPVLRPGYNPDDGFYIGGGLIFRKQQFGKSPYGWMQLIAANYAFETGAYNFWYRGLFNEAIGKWNVIVDARINAPNYVFNYFGMGNETKVLVDDKNFNRVRSDQWILKAGVGKRMGKFWNFEALPFYQSVEVEPSPDRFVTHHSASLDSTVFTKKLFGGAQFTMVYDNTNNALYPTRGVVVSSGLDVTSNLKDGSRQFARGTFSIAGFIPMKALTIALRAGTAANFGSEFEFYQSNTIGGSTNLRGFRRDRFSGKTSAYQNTEARLNFGTVNGYILKGQLGILAFSDVGRVWIPDEESNTWHWSYGGGIFFVPYNKIAFTITYGVSTEDQLLTLKAGFMF